MQTIIDLIPYVAGGYEVVARAIPTKKSYSIIDAVLKGLLFVSQFLNNKQKTK